MFSRYFQEELAYLRDVGREFSHAHPELAPLLATAGADPTIERFLEGVAFLTARIREKLDDELPEAIHGIASLLFPQMLRPLPSACMIELVPQLSVLREALRVPRGTEFGSVPIDGTTCRYQSTSETLLLPWKIEDARVESIPGGRQQLRLEMRLSGGRASVAAITGHRVRFHLAGERRLALEILAHLHENIEDVAIVEPNPRGGRPREISLGKRGFGLVGFDDADALLPTDNRLFPGYRLLQEYFALPEKFAFFELADLQRGMQGTDAAERYDICLRCKGTFPSASAISRDSVKLHCVPALNIFETSTEPLHLSPKPTRYRLRVSGLAAPHGEVYAIQRVTYMPHSSSERREIPDFYDFAYAGQRESNGGVFYNVHRKPSVVGDGTDVFVSFGTPRDSEVLPDAEVVSVDILATNGRLASMLRPGDIRLSSASSPALAQFKNLSASTPYVPSPVGRELAWRMVAQASMGMRSLADVDVLKALLETHNFQALVDRQAARANELRIKALRELKVAPAERLYRGSAVRGVAIDLIADEDGFAGDGDLFLFSAILDRLFGEYVSLNSFARVSVTGHATKVKYAWPARSGNLLLL